MGLIPMELASFICADDIPLNSLCRFVRRIDVEALLHHRKLNSEKVLHRSSIVVQRWDACNTDVNDKLWFSHFLGAGYPLIFVGKTVLHIRRKDSLEIYQAPRARFVALEVPIHRQACSAAFPHATNAGVEESILQLHHFPRVLGLSIFAASSSYLQGELQRTKTATERSLKRSSNNPELAVDQPDPVIQAWLLTLVIWNDAFRIDHDAWRLGLSALQLSQIARQLFTLQHSSGKLHQGSE
jgi:hypothetical protein